MVERAPQNDCCQRAVLVVIQLLSHVWLFVTSWTASRQAPLTFAIYWSLLKFMSIKLMMPSNHLILCHLLLLLPSIFHSIRVFTTSGGQSIGASASASVLPANIQGWFPLGLNGLISLLSKGISSLLQHRSSKASILWHSAFLMAQLPSVLQIYCQINFLEYSCFSHTLLTAGLLKYNAHRIKFTCFKCTIW